MNSTDRCHVSVSQKFSKSSLLSVNDPVRLYTVREVLPQCWWTCNAYKDAREVLRRVSFTASICQKTPRKSAIELKPIKPKPVQRNINAKPRSKAAVPSSLRMPRDPPLQVATPRPRLPRTKASDSDLSHFLAPPNITGSDLDKKSPEFRVAHVRYFNKLKREKFPMLDTKAYHAANESSLGVKLRRFQQWFTSYDNDTKQIKVKN